MKQEDLEIFLQAVGPEDPLSRLREEAISRGVPIIRPDSLSFLKTLIRLKRPEKILEIGGGIGYSALEMSLAFPGARIDSIELDPERAETARRLLKENGAAAAVLEGDAADWLERLNGPYDLIFLDGPKAQYIHYWPGIRALLPPGGSLVADNILQNQSLMESRYAVERRDRTIHDRLRAFVEAVRQDPGFTSCLLRTGDGLLWAVKEKEHE